MLPHALHRFLVVFGLYVLFATTGGLWVALARWIPEGEIRAAVTTVLCMAFAISFVWLLVDRLRRLISGIGSYWLDLLMAGINLTLLLSAFAVVYDVFGIVDTTQPGEPRVGGFWTCAYFSVVTFTTVGYGDLYPVGVSRILACIEGMTGFIVLGVLASASASLLQTSSESLREQVRDEASEQQANSESGAPGK